VSWDVSRFSRPLNLTSQHEGRLLATARSRTKTFTSNEEPVLRACEAFAVCTGGDEVSSAVQECCSGGRRQTTAATDVVIDDDGDDWIWRGFRQRFCRPLRLLRLQLARVSAARVFFLCRYATAPPSPLSPPPAPATRRTAPHCTALKTDKLQMFSNFMDNIHNISTGNSNTVPPPGAGASPQAMREHAAALEEQRRR